MRGNEANLISFRYSSIHSESWLWEAPFSILFFYYIFILFLLLFLGSNKQLTVQLKIDTFKEIIYLHKIKKALTYLMEHGPEAFKVVSFFFHSIMFWWNVISARNTFINYLFKGQALFRQNHFASVTSFTQKGFARRMMSIHGAIFFPAACQYTWML